MNTNRNWQKISGWVLHGLVAGIMILAGSAKVLDSFRRRKLRNSAWACPSR